MLISDSIVRHSGGALGDPGVGTVGGAGVHRTLPVYHHRDKFHVLCVCFVWPTHVNARNAFGVSNLTDRVTKGIHFDIFDI